MLPLVVRLQPVVEAEGGEGVVEEALPLQLQQPVEPDQ